MGSPFARDGSVAFHAGAPLVTPRGAVLGVPCAYDAEPRGFSEKEVAALRAMAKVLVILLLNEAA